MSNMKKSADIVEVSQRDPELVVLSTAPDRNCAERIAEALVRENLVSCAQVGGEIKSFYVWEGKFFAETEVKISLKLLKSRQEDAFKRFQSLHPYECPQWVSLKADSLSEDYARWLHGAL